MPFSDQGDVAHLESCLSRFDQTSEALAQRLALGGPDGEELRSLVETAVACRFRIQEWLAANDTVAVPQRLLKRARSIRDGRPSSLDKAPAALRERASEEWLQNEGRTGGVLEMVWAQQEFPEVMRGEMLARAYRCGGLVLGHAPLPILSRHQRTIKDAFVVGLFDAVIVFACALIEQVATDTLMQLNHNAAIPHCAPFDQRST